MPRTLFEPIRYEGEATKGSRFVTTIAPVPDEEAARELLARLRSELSDASHHCWAWRLATPTIDRAGDDGEPSGSAGRPMLAQLVGHDVLDVAAVVSRYFGGTKLGVGGLVRAYGGAVGRALDRAVLVQHQIMTAIQMEYEHSADRQLLDLVSESGAVSTSVVYGEAIVRQVSVPLDRLEQFRWRAANVTAGRAIVTERD